MVERGVVSAEQLARLGRELPPVIPSALRTEIRVDWTTKLWDTKTQHQAKLWELVGGEAG